MDFLKKHYEKVILGVVLLGLAAGAVFLVMKIPAERAEQQEIVASIISRPAKPLQPMDLTRQITLNKRVATEDCLDLTSTNKVFNSLQWQRRPDGSLLKIVLGNEVGPEAVQVTKITPLYTTIKLDSISTAADGTPRYSIIVEREGAQKVADRRPRQAIASLNAKTETFVIREVKGPRENPSELILEMNDTGQMLPLSKEKPIRIVDGYMADFTYPPDNKRWNNMRVGAGGPGTSPIIIAGEYYIVVAISKNELVLSAKSNNKKTPRPYNPTP